MAAIRINTSARETVRETLPHVYGGTRLLPWAPWVETMARESSSACLCVTGDKTVTRTVTLKLTWQPFG